MAPSLRKMLTALTTALAFSAASVSTTALAADKKVTISQAFQSMLYLPLYVAIDGGFFTKEGLDVTKQTAGSPSAALSAVLSGSADFSSRDRVTPHRIPAPGDGGDAEEN